MADLESVLADVSYLMTIEKSRSPNAQDLEEDYTTRCKVGIPVVRLLHTLCT